MEGSKYIMETYSRFPISLENGDGMYVTDTNGKRYLDFVAGIAVNALGYGNKKLADTAAEQAAKLIHCSNLYWTKPQVDLARLLVENSACMKKAFFCNSGAEAVEAALKLARKHGSEKGATNIIAMQNSFHGRTFGALSATGQTKYHKGFDPMLPGISHVPFNDIEALKAAVTEKTCAVILEPVQGEGGIIPANADYLRAVRGLCDEKNIVLIFDEVQCGMGRIGTLFAYQNFGVYPDVVVLAKGLAGGIPMGAILANEKFADTLKPGEHASTFGGNPFAAACAITVIKEIIGLLENVSRQGEYLTESLKKLKDSHTLVKQVRGVGLIQCLELDTPVKSIINACLEKGLLLVSSGEKVIRFVPPLIVQKNHIDEMCGMLDNALREAALC